MDPDFLLLVIWAVSIRHPIQLAGIEPLKVSTFWKEYSYMPSLVSRWGIWSWNKLSWLSALDQTTGGNCPCRQPSYLCWTGRQLSCHPGLSSSLKTLIGSLTFLSSLHMMISAIVSTLVVVSLLASAWNKGKSMDLLRWQWEVRAPWNSIGWFTIVETSSYWFLVGELNDELGIFAEFGSITDGLGFLFWLMWVEIWVVLPSGTGQWSHCCHQLWAIFCLMKLKH